MAAKTVNVLKLVGFACIVLACAVAVYYGSARSGRHPAGTAAGYFVVAAGTGMLFGLVRSFVTRKGQERGRLSVVLTGSLLSCVWLVPASGAVAALIARGTDLKVSLAGGAGAGLGFLAMAAYVYYGSKSNIAAARAAQRGSAVGGSLDSDAEAGRPFGSVPEAFRPRFAAGLECVYCGKTHGLTPGVVRKWHQCTGCGRVYCDDCGARLPGKRGLLEAERTCPSCGERTRLI